MFDMLSNLSLEKLGIVATLMVCTVIGSYAMLRKQLAAALSPLKRLLRPLQRALATWGWGTLETEYVGRHRAVLA